MKANYFIKYCFITNLVLILFSINIYSQHKDWKKVDTRPDIRKDTVFSSYRNIKCSDSLNCIVYGALYGYGGYYFRKTSDGGETWKTIYLDSAYFYDFDNMYSVPDINDIAYPSSNLFIAVGDSGLIVRTSDGGKTWKKSFFDKNCNLSRIRYLDSSYIILNGCNGKCENDSDVVFFLSTDMGESWNKMNRPKGVLFGEFNIVKKDLICGLTWMKTKDSISKEYIIWVHDNWKSWDTVPKQKYGFSLEFYNEAIGWLAGGKKVLDSSGYVSWSQLIVQTTNGGKTFNIQRDTVYNGTPIEDIRFYDTTFGIATSAYAHVLVTMNGGKTWENQTIAYASGKDGHYYAVISLQIPSSTIAYVILDNNYIYKYTRDSNAEVKENNGINDLSISPSPASDYISITIYNRRVNPAVDKVEIYDILGILYTPPNPLLIEGEQLRLDVSGFVPGVYFVKIGDRVQRFVKM